MNPMVQVPSCALLEPGGLWGWQGVTVLPQESAGQGICALQHFGALALGYRLQIEELEQSVVSWGKKWEVKG